MNIINDKQLKIVIAPLTGIESPARTALFESLRFAFIYSFLVAVFLFYYQTRFDESDRKQRSILRNSAMTEKKSARTLKTRLLNYNRQ